MANGKLKPIWVIVKLTQEELTALARTVDHRSDRDMLLTKLAEASIRDYLEGKSSGRSNKRKQHRSNAESSE